MKIKAFRYPSLILSLSEKEDLELNMEDFLNHITPDPKSPYRKIIEPNVFKMAFISNDKLVWGNIIEATMCGGDTSWRSAEFSVKEIVAFKKGKTVQNE